MNKPARQTNADQLPAEMPKAPGTALEVLDFGELAGYGTKNLTADDKTTPLLAAVHYQCPQITRGDPKFILGAQPGYIFDGSIGQAWEGEEVGLDIVVCGTKRRYLEWIPRQAKPGESIMRVRSGNFRGFHEVATVRRLLGTKFDKFGALPWKNNDGETVQLVETGELFVLYAPPPLTHDNARRAMINFKSTGLKMWRSYNDRHESFRFKQGDGSMKSAPVCWWRWRLRTKATSNDQGKWFLWDVELESKVSDPETFPVDNQVAVQDPKLFEMAEASMRQYYEGQVQEYRPDDDDQTAGGGSVINPDDVPF